MKDKYGHSFEVGDWLLYFTRSGSNVELWPARVLHVNEGALRIKVYDEGRYHNTIRETTIRTPGNCVHVDGFDIDVEAQFDR